uniref:Uncharacterized protein n=1 Tax=Leersia perrieri TaxID=77586 RepID=A0A0D9WNM6_9ORYZ
MGASVLMIEGLTDLEQVEAIACREGMTLAVRSTQGAGKGLYGHIVQEIQTRKSDFISDNFVHEPHSSNLDAHMIARSLVYEPIGRHVWYSSPPEGAFVMPYRLDNKECGSLKKKKIKHETV